MDINAVNDDDRSFSSSDSYLAHIVEAGRRILCILTYVMIHAAVMRNTCLHFVQVWYQYALDMFVTSRCALLVVST